jgi:hypothetical protein
MTKRRNTDITAVPARDIVSPLPIAGELLLTELGPVDGYHGIGKLAWGFGPPGAAPVRETI